MAQFVAQLLDLAAIRVVEVLHSLLSMGAFTLNVGSGSFPLGGHCCQVAAQLSHRLAEALMVGADNLELALSLFGSSVCAVGSHLLSFGATLGGACTLLCFGTGLLLPLRPFCRDVTFLLNLTQLRANGGKVGS
jgi:hypothetical protein